ncbi:virulence associated lipoprotein [Borreliella andersonii]|uniref:Virulence associated lipoprotein n=1 Tax=Borrelia andersonii TaxID=42109 RepID=A0ACD5G641_BORAD
MKYHIIANIFVFLFLACRSDFNTDQKDIKHPPTEKSRTKTEDPKQEESKTKTEEKGFKKKQEEGGKEEGHIKKNILLHDLKNSIETAYAYKEKYIKRMKEEPEDQYGVQAFKVWNWGKGTEKMSDNTERSIKFRRHTYTILSVLDIDELKEFSNIILLAKEEHILGVFSMLGEVLDIAIDHLHPKKGKLNKLDTSDLNTLKISFDKILSIVESISGMSQQLLLDYKNNKNIIKTDINELKSHVNKLKNQFREQAIEARNLQKFIVSKYKL